MPNNALLVMENIELHDVMMILRRVINVSAKLELIDITEQPFSEKTKTVQFKQTCTTALYQKYESELVYP